MVCFVILHYMVLNETIICVDSIVNNVSGEKKIVIVDNASPNGTIKELYDTYRSSKDIHVIGTESNLGFARGNNYGYQYAIKEFSPAFIVVMNNDMEIKQVEFIDGIKKSYIQYQYFIMGPDIYSTKKCYHQNPQTRRVPTKDDLKKACKKLWMKEKLIFLISLKWKIIELMGCRFVSLEHKREIPFVDKVVVNHLLHGACYIFSPLFIAKHQNGCFYSKTFMYMEAEILYYLAIKNGEKIIYYPAIKVDHHEDMATDFEFKKQYKKSAFSVRCLLQSNRVFLELIENDGQKS